jgi:hypothetical protein
LVKTLTCLGSFIAVVAISVERYPTKVGRPLDHGSAHRFKLPRLESVLYLYTQRDLAD